MMAKPRIIIADTDLSYVAPLQAKFVEDFFGAIDLEIITDPAYFNQLFSSPQNADALVISERLYGSALERHGFGNIFLLSEQPPKAQAAGTNVISIFKYSSIKEIMNVITGKCVQLTHLSSASQKESQIVLVCSACGGVGKTTVAMGMSACLSKDYKRTLYLNMGGLQSFQWILSDFSPISDPGVYARLVRGGPDIYRDIKHTIRRQELFSYLPPLKTALMSLGLSHTIYEQLALEAKNSGDYDFIILDTDSSFDESTAKLLSLADRVVIVTKQTRASIFATNLLVSNISGVNTDKYIFVCNDLDVEQDATLSLASLPQHFNYGSYVPHIAHYDQMKPQDLAEEDSLQRAALLLL